MRTHSCVTCSCQVSSKSLEGSAYNKGWSMGRLPMQLGKATAAILLKMIDG